jgi:hypothetical protein
VVDTESGSVRHSQPEHYVSLKSLTLKSGSYGFWPHQGDSIEDTATGNRRVHTRNRSGIADTASRRYLSATPLISLSLSAIEKATPKGFHRYRVGFAFHDFVYASPRDIQLGNASPLR